MLPKMTLDEVLSKLTSAGIEPLQVEEIQYGKKVTCKNGAIVNVFDKGTVNVQGKAQEETKAALGAPIQAQKKSKDGPNKTVFVVYGHNTQVKLEAQVLLHKLGLNPLLVEDLPKRGRTLIESLENALEREPAFTLVLWTPDDAARPRDSKEEPYLQPRPNVLIELGLVIGRFGRENVGVLYQKADRFEDPSDVKGLFSERFEKSLKEIEAAIIKELTAAGLPIDHDKFFGGAKP